jgi:hypothetical protein
MVSRLAVWRSAVDLQRQALKGPNRDPKLSGTDHVSGVLRRPANDLTLRLPAT